MATIWILCGPGPLPGRCPLLSAKWHAFIYWLSSDIGFTAWTLVLALTWRWAGRLSSPILWALTGIGLGFAYWWRTAALGLIAGTLLVCGWILLRQRRVLPFVL